MSQVPVEARPNHQLHEAAQSMEWASLPIVARNNNASLPTYIIVLLVYGIKLAMQIAVMRIAVIPLSATIKIQPCEYIGGEPFRLTIQTRTPGIGLRFHVSSCTKTPT
jgi:hypothetical protein